MNPAEDLPDEVRDRAYYAQPAWKRMVVIAAGPAVNLVVAFVLLFVFFAAIGPQDAHEVGAIEKGYPAAACSSRRQADGGGRRPRRAGQAVAGRSPRTSVRRARRRLQGGDARQGS